MVESKLIPKIITFKKKDQRQEQKLDKQEILKKHIKTRMDFCDIITMQDMGSVPLAFDGTLVGHDINIYDLPIISGSFTEKEIKAIENDVDVEMIEDDPIALAMPIAQPIGEQVTIEKQQTPIKIEDVPSTLAEILPWGVNRIDAERAWNVTRGAGIRVAVIDTGIDTRHQDLSPNIGGGVSFVPGESYMDGNGHGTHVAGTIGARQNGSGVVGVAPNCSLYAVKALNNLGQGNYSWIISAIIWCVRTKMDVVNMSLGGPTHVQALQNACDYAFQKNVLIVAAAGNSGPRDNTVGYPGRYDSVISVSAIDTTGNIANFSSRGHEVDITAPGVNILSTIPGNRYGIKNGTSMASPHVAGAAALTISSHRFTQAETIRRILLRTADNLGISGRDNEYGHGLVDVEQSAFMRQLS
jgi:subtilisin